jgi:hypothetical protein
MPVEKYFKGGGEKVMKNMKKEYGPDKGENVFYALANKQKAAEENARSYAEERNAARKTRS